MAFDGWIPEIVIGVDFGMTCTGMTYATIASALSVAFQPNLT